MNARTPLATAVVTLLFASFAQGHFAWLSSDDDGRALLYFAESPLRQDYHMPDAVAEAKVLLKKSDDEAAEVDLTEVDTDDYVGRKSEAGVVDSGVLTTTCNYGNYHGSLLTYYVKHYAGQLDKAAKLEGKAQPKGFVFDVRPSLFEGGVALVVSREGKPVKGAGVSVIDPNGERAEKETGKDGTVKFYNLAEGNLGFIVGVTEKTEGEVDGEKYTSAAHYLTVTFSTSTPATDATASDVEETAEAKTEEAKPVRQSALPPLPEAIASFGAAVCDGNVYVYSGHIGKSHHHSVEHYSQHFRRIPLTGGQWEELPFGEPLQGLAMVPHNGCLYRVGGMNARNAKKEPEDMHSVDSFEKFDPKTNAWTTLAPLPTPRSSLDAVVIDGWLYVVGGWNLDGSADGEWSDATLKIDLANTDAGWQSAAKTPFQRRALTASFVDKTLVVIGGIDDAGDISREVNALDTESGEWSTLDDLPGEGMQGFGVSAWNHNGTLYVSGSSGIVFRLGDDRKWHEAAKLADHRFFHRLLPAGKSRLLMIGGASMDRQAHVADSEWVELGDGA